MGAELKEILTAANEKTQYDTYAKRLLSEKCILACILTEVVDEFKGMNDVRSIAEDVDASMELICEWLGLAPVTV